MADITREYILWCLKRFADLGFRGLKKKDTKAKYAEIVAMYPDTELIEILRPYGELPKLKEGSIISSTPKKEG